MKAKQGAKEFSLPQADVRQWVQEQKSDNGRRKKPAQSQERLTATREHKWAKIRLDLCWEDCGDSSVENGWEGQL